MSFQPKGASAKGKSNDVLEDGDTVLAGLQLAKVRQWIGKDGNPTAVGWGRDSDVGVGKTSEEGDEEKQKRD